jgi:hypothetical protein
MEGLSRDQGRRRRRRQRDEAELVGGHHKGKGEMRFRARSETGYDLVQ